MVLGMEHTGTRIPKPTKICKITALHPFPLSFQAVFGFLYVEFTAVHFAAWGA